MLGLILIKPPENELTDYNVALRGTNTTSIPQDVVLLFLSKHQSGLFHEGKWSQFIYEALGWKCAQGHPQVILADFKHFRSSFFLVDGPVGIQCRRVCLSEGPSVIYLKHLITVPNVTQKHPAMAFLISGLRLSFVLLIWNKLFSASCPILTGSRASFSSSFKPSSEPPVENVPQSLRFIFPPFPSPKLQK